MIETRRQGNISESKIISRLLEKGYIVSQPFGGSDRYDLLVDDGTNIEKIQCKTGKLVNGALRFFVCSSHKYKNGMSKKSYKGQIDKFAVYSPELGKVFIVPIPDNERVMYLRVNPTKNNQKCDIRWAKDYEI